MPRDLKKECVLRERLEMFVVLLMFSVKPCLRKKVSNLAETEETQLYLPGEKEREKWRELWAEQKVLRLFFVLQNQLGKDWTCLKCAQSEKDEVLV